MNADWIIPDWPAPGNVRAVCTTRAGGCSRPPYDSLNLGDHVGDEGADVAQNRANLQRQIGARPVFLKQVHGIEITQLFTDTADGADGADGVDGADSTVADGCLTRASGIACTIMVADCLPVLLTNLKGDFVAAAHAGWRGLAGAGSVGVLEAVCQAIESNAPGRPAGELLAWLGPCIGATRFEVGDEVLNAFVRHDAAAFSMFKPVSPGKWLADLQGLARLRLRALGVNRIFGNDGSLGWCTASQPSRFFSHRRDHVALGGSGRMAACIWLD